MFPLHLAGPERAGGRCADTQAESLQPPSSEPKELWPQHCYEANSDCLETAARPVAPSSARRYLPFKGPVM